METRTGRLLAEGDGLVSRAQLLAATGSDSTLRAAVRRGELVRVLHGVYADVLLTPDPWLRCRAALFAAPPGSALCGLAAAALHAPVLDPPSRPTVLVPPDRRVHRVDVGCSRVAASEAEVVVVDGLRVTSPLRTAVDVARGPGRRTELIVVLDALLGATGTSVCQVEDRVAVLADRRPARGLVRALQLLAEVEPRAGSPMESRLRLVLVDGGLPRPRAQIDVHDEQGGWLACHDLAYPAARVALEYLGDVHLQRAVSRKDRRRRNVLALRAGGWVVLDYGGEEVLHRPRLVTGEVEEVLAVRAPELLLRPR